MAYIPIEIETEPSDLAEDAYAYLEETVPGWLPSPGNLEAWLIESLAQLAGELRDLAALVPEEIFVYFGSSVIGLQPYAPAAAAAPTTWTMIDAAGYTVDAGTLLAVEPPGDPTNYAFEVVEPFAVANGSTEAVGIIIRALEPGGDASGITGAVELLDPLDFVQSVTLDAPTSGGVDAEETDAYMARLSSLLTLLTPRPILPQDFALLAEQMVPAVGRATAIDLYNADTGAVDEPRCVTVIVADTDGQPVTPETKAQVDQLLQAEREVNFLVFVDDPTYDVVDVDFQATALRGQDPALVEANVVAAITAYLSPASWGRPTEGDPGSTGSWTNTTVVRYWEVIALINDVEGVNYVTSLSLNGGAENVDVVLAGTAPLPTAGTITGSVVPTP